MFGKGSLVFEERGLILVDTKYEFGIDENGELIIIDELHTSDSSRIWKAESYEERFQKGVNPESYDKEILRKWLAEHGFSGEGLVPVVDPEVIARMSLAYNIPFFLLTRLIMDDSRPPKEIKDAIVGYFEKS